MRSLLGFLALASLTVAWYYGRPDPGSSTTGGVWPLPQYISYGNSNHTVNPGRFRFQAKTPGCDIIDKAIQRYQKLSFPKYDSKTYSAGDGTLASLLITVTQPCPSGSPQMEMDETYKLDVIDGRGIATITANQVWGALRAMESFSQLVFIPQPNVFYVRTAQVMDSPRFPWRGVLIDSSRHFLPVGVLLENLDLMAQNKMNVMHWHLTDSESIPYPSLRFPQLTAKGAYSPRHQYTVADIKKVIDYARLRGIRVVAEFDTPGHTGAWGYGIANLTSKCFRNDMVTPGELSNIIDPTLTQNFNFLQGFFEEALALFPDNYMHFGGDEVIWDMKYCWYNNKEVRARMEKQGFGDDTSKLLDFYFKTLFGIINNARKGTKKIVWQEVLDMNVPQQNTIAHVWKGDNYDNIMKEMSTVTKNGHYAILSSCWYLNYIKYGADWGYLENKDNLRLRGMYYECDPTDFDGTDEQKKLVLGGEAVMFGEFVDSTNLISRLWPRASAVAERLWSDKDQIKSADAAWPRLHEHRCRMMNRGFRVQPIMDPDYCPFEWDESYTEL